MHKHTHTQTDTHIDTHIHNKLTTHTHKQTHKNKQNIHTLAYSFELCHTFSQLDKSKGYDN